MSELSSVNTSFYPELLEGFAPKSMLPVPAVDSDRGASTYYSGNQNSDKNSKFDLSNYYNEVRPEDLLVKTGQNLVALAQALDNTMVVAMQNGYSVQEVCNIRLAEMAYKANAHVFDVAKEISTFEVDV